MRQRAIAPSWPTLVGALVLFAAGCTPTATQSGSSDASVGDSVQDVAGDLDATAGDATALDATLSELGATPDATTAADSPQSPDAAGTLDAAGTPRRSRHPRRSR